MLRSVCKSSAIFAAPFIRQQPQVRLIRTGRRIRANELKHIIFWNPAAGERTEPDLTMKLAAMGPPTKMDQCKAMYCRVLNSNEYDIVREYTIKAKDIAYPLILQLWCQVSHYAQRMYEHLYPKVMRIYWQSASVGAIQMQMLGNRLYAYWLQMMCTFSSAMDKARMQIKKGKK